MSCHHAPSAALAALVAGILALTACAPDEDAAPASVQARATEICDSLASRCGRSTADAQMCEPYLLCTAKLVRPEILDAVFTCMAAESCDAAGHSELCYLPDVAGFVASPRWAIYEPACLARLDVCAAEGAPYINDFCQKPFSAATDDVLDAMQACLDGPCAAVMECAVAVTTDLCAAP